VSWQRVRGHEALIEKFDRLVRRGRLGHAYLFAGPAGIGKHLFADELAKALLCEGKDGRLEACDRCPSCKQFEAGVHPDFAYAARPEESLELPIEAIRELCRTFGLKPARGRGKVAILDNADDLNDAAANCFLKTLEEPPERSALLLIATNPDLQLPTIVSRCQTVRFQPLAPQSVKEILQAHGLEDPALVDRLARLSNGSPGQALALGDPELWVFRRQLLERLSQPRLDSVMLARDWIRFVEEAGKESAVQRRRAGATLHFLIEFLEEALIVSQSGPSRAEDDDLPRLKNLAERVGPDVLLRLLDRCLEAAVHIERRVQLVLVIESLVDAVGRKLE
jgi:DNA polymerase III subunit delta'